MESTTFLGQMVTAFIDRPLGTTHPTHGFLYPVNYGYVPDTIVADGEPLDVYVLGVTQSLRRFSGVCVAIIHRLNDDDDKLVLIPVGTAITDEEIRQTTCFQEQFFKSVIIR